MVVFVLFLSPSRKMTGCNLKVGSDFITQPFDVTVHGLRTTRCKAVVKHSTSQDK
jgi:hypothetical protein